MAESEVPTIMTPGQAWSTPGRGTNFQGAAARQEQSQTRKLAGVFSSGLLSSCLLAEIPVGKALRSSTEAPGREMSVSTPLALFLLLLPNPFHSPRDEFQQVS